VASLNKARKTEEIVSAHRDQQRLRTVIPGNVLGLGLSLDTLLTRTFPLKAKNLERALDHSHPSPMLNAAGLSRRRACNQQENQQRLQKAHEEAGLDHGFNSLRVAWLAFRWAKLVAFGLSTPDCGSRSPGRWPAPRRSAATGKSANLAAMSPC
jgi:hypothetical protein